MAKLAEVSAAVQGGGSILGAIGNIVQRKKERELQEKQYNQDYAFQREQYNYQKNLQKTIFNREDTAVQRRAADFERSGLSKTLAAGGAASAGQAVHVSSRQPRGYSSDGGAVLQGVGEGMKGLGTVLTNALAIKNLENQVLQGKENIANTQAERERIMADVGIQKLEAASKEWNLEYARKNKLPYGVAELKQFQALDKVGSVLKDTYDVFNNAPQSERAKEMNRRVDEADQKMSEELKEKYKKPWYKRFF